MIVNFSWLLYYLEKLNATLWNNTFYAGRSGIYWHRELKKDEEEMNAFGERKKDILGVTNVTTY